MIKNIIWDFDGTLVDTYGIMSKAFCIALNKRNIMAKEAEVNKLLKVSSEYAINYFGLDKSFKKIWKDEEKKVDKNLSKPFENVENILKYIIKNGGKNYIVTHRDKTTFEYLKFYNLEKYFDDIVTIEDADYRKPNIDMFKKLISRNNINIKETLSVGDRILDMIPSKEMKLMTCYFNNENIEIGFIVDITVR
ncbi:MAG: HAD-IA family hydrolase, partial [Bacillota bacterium]|nr:HAD-IA family hydrolase [Bacillota bacterium]